MRARTDALAAARTAAVPLGCAEFPGTVASVPDARDWVRSVLGAGHPARDSADLCVTELAANAVAYTRSGLVPGGTFTVTVEAVCHGRAVRIGVHDLGGPGRPAQGGAGPDDEHGRGLVLVRALSARWGSRAELPGRLTWCDLAIPRARRHRAPPM